MTGRGLIRGFIAFSILGGWGGWGGCQDVFGSVPTPVLEYRFDTQGTTQASGGSDALSLTGYAGGTPLYGGTTSNLGTGSPRGPSGRPSDFSLNLGTNTQRNNVALSSSSADYTALNSLGSFTLTAWVNSTAVNGTSGYIASLLATNANSIGFSLSSPGVGQPTYETVKINGDRTISSSQALPVSSSDWLFVAVSFDYRSGNLNFYDAGVSAMQLQSAQASANGQKINGGNTNFAVGASGPSGSFQFPGAIDDVGLYNSALSPSDLMQVHDSALPEPGTLACIGGAIFLMRRRPRA